MTLTDAFLTNWNKNALEVATPIHLKMLSDSYPVSECTATWWVWGAKFTLNHYVFRKTFFFRRWLGDNTSTVTPGSVQVMKWPAYLTCRFMQAVINLPLLLDWCPCVFWSRHQSIITLHVVLPPLFRYNKQMLILTQQTSYCPAQ